MAYDPDVKRLSILIILCNFSNLDYHTHNYYPGYINFVSGEGPL